MELRKGGARAGGYKGREAERERQTDTYRQTDTDTDIQAHRDREEGKQADRHTDRQTSILTN